MDWTCYSSDTDDVSELLFDLGSQLAPNHSICIEESLSDTDTTVVFPTPFDEQVPAPQCPPPAPGSSKRFRLCARNLFLTYPQCSVDPSVVLERLKTWSTHSTPVEWAIVAQEHHKDGSLHLHCCVHLKKKKNFHGAACFDFLTQKHGNYRGCRNLQDVVR